MSICICNKNCFILILIAYKQLQRYPLSMSMDKNDKFFWSKVVTKILKAELAKRAIDYPALVARLNTINVNISVEDLRGRMSRGTFSAILFIQCLRAIGVTQLSIEESFFEDLNKVK
jgi:hypothetical protein